MCMYAVHIFRVPLELMGLTTPYQYGSWRPFTYYNDSASLLGDPLPTYYCSGSDELQGPEKTQAAVCFHPSHLSHQHMEFHRGIPTPVQRSLEEWLPFS